MKTIKKIKIVSNTIRLLDLQQSFVDFFVLNLFIRMIRAKKMVLLENWWMRENII